MNFINGAQLLEYCEKEKKKISEAMFERETTFLEQDGEKTRARMKKAFSIMQAAVTALISCTQRRRPIYPSASRGSLHNTWAATPPRPTTTPAC